MAPLRLLEREFSIIDAAFLQFCASHGVLTEEDFLLQDVNTLLAFAEKRYDSDRLKQGIAQLLSIMDARHQPWSSGLELLQDANLHKHVLLTGCQGIDLLLGGLHKGQITELVGPSSSGKTQVCLQVSANIASKYGCTVVYLDTGHAFSPHRVGHFVGGNLHAVTKEDQEKILQGIMSRILCYSVFDIFSLMDVLHQLESRLLSEMQPKESQVHLLIIDSMSSLVTPVLGGNGSHGHALMVSAGFLLKKLAHEHNIAVLVSSYLQSSNWETRMCLISPLLCTRQKAITPCLFYDVINHMVGGEGGNPKPALGESWKSIPHVRLLLSRQHGSNSCSISVLKHTTMASRKVVKFKMPD